MKLHADLRQHVVIDIKLTWMDSPMPGMQRRKLDRDGEEAARATSIICYGPDSPLASYTHSGSA
ncbi:MAG: hypothetical protein BJG00_007645 [Limnothrix sp. CACIAM 69d]|nr:MAG: hypothetical protein BJG00_007645 [Limnothrix sp. CACIAM 69d]